MDFIGLVPCSAITMNSGDIPDDTIGPYNHLSPANPHPHPLLVLRVLDHVLQVQCQLKLDDTRGTIWVLSHQPS